ncbi:hypothetical protein [Clostridium baratii]|uniref:hypothetical protein n=1 Tax=Clostridium baratii TaxID=1561 RepID=UPI0030CD1A36
MEINKEGHKYKKLAKEINQAFYEICDNDKCEKCKYYCMPSCRTLFTLDYLESKGYEFKE